MPFSNHNLSAKRYRTSEAIFHIFQPFYPPSYARLTNPIVHEMFPPIGWKEKSRKDICYARKTRGRQRVGYRIP
jgi:hypothetical protein